MTAFTSPGWLVNLANAMVVAHLGPAYQVGLRVGVHALLNCQLARGQAGEGCMACCAGHARCFRWWSHVQSLQLLLPPAPAVQICIQPTFHFLEVLMQSSQRNPRWNQVRTAGHPAGAAAINHAAGSSCRTPPTPPFPPSQGLLLRLWFRSLTVVLLTFLAILMPFFESIIGLSGALSEGAQLHCRAGWGCHGSTGCNRPCSSYCPP